jgi:hypothetical protein
MKDFDAATKAPYKTKSVCGPELLFAKCKLKV